MKDSPLFLRKKQRWASITRHHELALPSSTPWGICLLICIYWNIAQLLRGLISHPEDDKTNDTGGDGGSQYQTRDKDSGHFAALPSLLCPARAAHATTELLWGRLAPGREKIKEETQTNHPRLMTGKKMKGLVRGTFRYARIIINPLQLPMTKSC